MRAWFFDAPENAAVIALHGQADNRAGMLGYAGMLLLHGFDVLLPDARFHGSSGGEIAGYGVHEAGALTRWIDWLRTKGSAEPVFGLGESQQRTYPVDPRLRGYEHPPASFTPAR